MGDSHKLLPAAFLNHRAGQGYILNPRRVEGLWRRRIWEFRLLQPTPLMFRDRDGLLWQVDRHEAETDLGSIPSPLRGFFPQDEWVLSYIYHDSACRRGGLWVSHPSAERYVFNRLTRAEADRMLRDEWIPAESALTGGGTWSRWPIYVGVRIGAAALMIEKTWTKEKTNGV